MNKKIIVILCVLVTLVALKVIFFNKALAPTENTNVTESQNPKAPTVLYENKNEGFTFEYPSNLYLKEGKLGESSNGFTQVILVENNEYNKSFLEGKATVGEGPTSITVEVYPNPNKLNSLEWALQDKNWTVFNRSAGTSIKINNNEGSLHTWSGLYEGKSVVFTKDNKAYVFSVTWIDRNDQLLRDFDIILNSLTFK